MSDISPNPQLSEKIERFGVCWYLATFSEPLDSDEIEDYVQIFLHAEHNHKD